MNTAIPSSADADFTYRKILWRIMPFLVLCYVLAFIDRANVGFAKLQFIADLGFNETIYGIGGSAFYLGYILLEIPSNLYLQKIGVRKTLLRIMLLWGLCCAGMAFMASANAYYVLRFLLGAAEAGFFPGILLYITFWVPASRRARFTAIFMASIPLSGMIGGPLSGWIMHSLDGVYGMKGWQWLFIAEGLPASLVGIIAYYYLDDSAAQSKWLSDSEKSIVQRDLDADNVGKAKKSHHSFIAVLKDAKIYWFVGMAFAAFVSTGGISFWLPTIIKNSGVSNTLTIGLISAIPYFFAVVVQYLNARHSDKTQERRWHTAIPALVAALSWMLMPVARDNAVLSVVLLTLAAAGTFSLMGPFWTLPPMFLSGTAAAGGIALLTTLAGFGNVVSPIFVGWLSTETGNLIAGQFYFATVLLIGVITLLIGLKSMSKQHD